MQIESFVLSIYKSIEYFQGVNIQESIFEAFSEHYYKENFHSDILAYYLKHKEVMSIFLKWIGDGKINEADYEDCSIIREQGRVDILIYNNNKNSAIIVENKSNDAVDQYRQIPRYVDKLKEKEISIDRILYLNKNSLSLPNTSDWTQNDKDTIMPKIKIAQLLGKDSISDNLLKEVILKTSNIRLDSLSQEILIMFTNSVHEVKNLSMLDELYEFLKNEENHEKLTKIINAYNNIPIFLASHYKKYYDTNKDKIIEKVWLYRPHILVFEMSHKNRQFGLDIVFRKSDINISIIGRGNTDCNEIKNDIGDNFILSRNNNNERYNLQIDSKKMFDDKALIDSIDNIINSFKQ